MLRKGHNELMKRSEVEFKFDQVDSRGELRMRQFSLKHNSNLGDISKQKKKKIGLRR